MADHGWFIIQKASDGQYYFVLEASNDKTIAISEMYTTKAAAQNGIASVRETVPTAVTIDVTT